MKTKTIITELTQEDLVNLLCTATYGSNWLSCYAPDRDFVENLPDTCREDIWAKVLLAGKSIICTDYYAEGESYGNLPCGIDEEDNANYTLTLQDVINGLQKCMDGTFKDAEKYSDKGFVARCFSDLANDGDNWDYTEADSLMQIILFGELIYG